MPNAKRIPHINAEAHAKVVAKFRHATREERIESLKRAGILTKSGRFAAPYREFEALVMPKRRKATVR